MNRAGAEWHGPAPGAGLHVTEVPAPGSARSEPIVVFVHGSLDRGASFARTVRRLPDLMTIAYDRRGYQASRHAGSPVGLEGHVDDLLAVVDGRIAVVVGHSYGGDVALQAAVRAPALVRAVGAYEPPLPWVDWWPRPAQRPRDGVDAAAFAESFFQRVAGVEAWNRLSEAQKEDRRADGPALLAEMTDLRRDGARVVLEDVAVPTVAGVGEMSRPHHRAASAHVAATITGAELFEIAGAAHGAHLTHPDAFARFVRRVVDRAPGAG